MRKNLFLVLLAGVLAYSCLMAAPVTEKDVTQAVTGWLNLDQSPLGTVMNRAISKVDKYTDKGEALFYVVSFDGGGYVVTSSDDLMQPVVAFSQSGEFDASDQNPLFSALNYDMKNRVIIIRDFAAKAANPGVLSVDDNKVLNRLEELNSQWLLFKEASVSGDVDTKGISTITDVRVSPLVQSKWGQSTVGGVQVYNTYTPSNYVCGCVATAMSQVMRFHQYPVDGVGVSSHTIEVDGVSQTASTRGGDGSGGAYSWSSMPLDPASDITSTERLAIGALCYDAGVASSMSYGAYGSGAFENDAAYGLLNVFDYESAIYYMTYGYDTSSDFRNRVINCNLDAGFPVMVGITGDGGHEIVCDGYGYNFSSLYHHMNMGWSGSEDLWYALPDIGTGYNFDIIDGFIYNIFPTESGEIISGRVVDSNGAPVSGVTVSAGGYSDTTDTRGIYALRQVSAGTYTINASKIGYLPESVSETVTDSYNYLSWSGSADYNACGNIWGVDFTMQLGNVLTAIEISGVSTIPENSFTNYTCTAIYSDGSSSNVTDKVTWSENSPYASISSGGWLSAWSVYLDQSLFVSASYTVEDITVTDELAVTIIDTETAAKYSGGDGSEENPYWIDNLADLMYLSDHTEDYDKCFIVTCKQIDLSEIEFANAIIAPDTSTDFGFQGVAFTGSFNGNNILIYGAEINADYGYGFLGFFGCVSGSVSNLTVAGISISGTGTSGGYLGGICGQLDSGSIDCCFAHGSVKGTLGASAVGGLCGKVMGGTVRNSFADVDVTGQVSVGGLCGFLMNGAIVNCYSSGVVTGLTTSNIGGFCGVSVNGTCESSFWDIQASGQSTSAAGTGKTSLEMMSEATFSDAGWDFDNIWEMRGYPCFKWSWIWPDGSLLAVVINGSEAIDEDSSLNFTCTALYNDGDTEDVTSSAIWTDNSPYASVSEGVLSAAEVSSDEDVIISVSYTENGISREGTYSVTIKDVAAGSMFSGGTGTESDPYQIANKADLLYLAAHSNSYGKCYIMVSDIDLTGEVFDKAVIAPDPVNDDYDYQGIQFTGSFNGDGYFVKNLTISETEAEIIGYLGLFGFCSGSISNVFVENVDVSVSGWDVAYVGSICGWLTKGSITKCGASGELAINGAAVVMGGLCGMNEYGTIEDSYSLVDLNAPYYYNCGGFCGVSFYGTFRRCFSAGEFLNTFMDGVLGFCGDSYALGSVIEDCFWDTDTSHMTYSAGGTGKTTEEMQTQSTFVNWDFSNTWYMDGYPALSCFDRTGTPISGTYAAWLLNNPTIPEGLRGQSDTPAGDNIPNLLKYACGLSAMTFCTTADLMTIDSVDSGTFSILYYKSKTAEDVTLQPIWAETLLGPWNTLGITTEMIGQDADREQWKASVPMGESGFIKLRVTAE